MLDSIASLANLATQQVQGLESLNQKKEKDISTLREQFQKEKSSVEKRNLAIEKELQILKKQNKNYLMSYNLWRNKSRIVRKWLTSIVIQRIRATMERSNKNNGENTKSIVKGKLLS